MERNGQVTVSDTANNPENPVEGYVTDQRGRKGQRVKKPFTDSDLLSEGASWLHQPWEVVGSDAARWRVRTTVAPTQVVVICENEAVARHVSEVHNLWLDVQNTDVVWLDEPRSGREPAVRRDSGSGEHSG